MKKHTKKPIVGIGGDLALEVLPPSVPTRKISYNKSLRPSHRPCLPHEFFYGNVPTIVMTGERGWGVAGRN